MKRRAESRQPAEHGRPRSEQEGWRGWDPVRSTGVSQARLLVGRTPHSTIREEPLQAQRKDPTGALHSVMSPTGSFYRSPDQI